jgi:hypothetical protein
LPVHNHEGGEAQPEDPADVAESQLHPPALAVVGERPPEARPRSNSTPTITNRATQFCHEFGSELSANTTSVATGDDS